MFLSRELANESESWGRSDQWEGMDASAMFYDWPVCSWRRVCEDDERQWWGKLGKRNDTGLRDGAHMQLPCSSHAQ